MAKKPVKSTEFRLTLFDLRNVEDRIHSALSKGYDSVLQIADSQNLIRAEIKSEALEIVKAHRALTHFSWEKLAETQDIILKAQNTALRTMFLVSTAQCIATLMVVGAILWLR